MNDKSKIIWDQTDETLVAHSRAMALDALKIAGTGHTGATLSLMPLIYFLYVKQLVHDPKNPSWECRDHLILSCGHVSLALYIQLYLSGYELTFEDIKNFRQLESKTPGHPEFGVTPGVEVTTGPLGQGFANAVGIALSKKLQTQNLNLSSPERSKTYAIVSDGDLQEGITFEAANIAKLYGLSDLIVFYDSNGITIDGPTYLNSQIHSKNYFESMGWQVQNVSPGENGDINIFAVHEAIQKAENSQDPSLIILDTKIGWPSPRFMNTSFIHGNLLPDEEVAAIHELLDAKKLVGKDFDPKLLKLVRNQIQNRLNISKNIRKNINKPVFKIDKFEKELETLKFFDRVSTRKANAKILELIKNNYFWTFGGSADLTESNSLSLEDVFLNESSQIDGKFKNNLIFGIREHAMSAISNGMSLDKANISYCATYLVFSDYQKPAIRLAAMMDLPITYIWTHDSIAVGADGPTHQPVDQIPMLRAIPNFSVIRPSTANELKTIWKKILSDKKPVGLILSRQDLTNFELTELQESDINRGAYVALNSNNNSEPDLIILATGSEVDLAINAAKELEKLGYSIQVSSLICQEWFDVQSDNFKKSIIGEKARPILTLEASSTFGWEKYHGGFGKSIGITTFGQSGSSNDLLEKFGFSVSNIVSKSIDLISLKDQEIS